MRDLRSGLFSILVFWSEMIGFDEIVVDKNALEIAVERVPFRIVAE
jgi:hypothetical protein